MHPSIVFGAQPDLITTLEASRLTVQDDGLGTQIWTIGLFQIPSGTIYRSLIYVENPFFIAIFWICKLTGRRRAWNAGYKWSQTICCASEVSISKTREISCKTPVHSLSTQMLKSTLCTILWAEVLGQAISWRFHLCVTSSSAFLTSGYVLHACHVRAFLSSNKMLLSDLRAKTFGCHKPRVQSTIPEEDMVQIGSCYHFSRGHCLQRRRHRRCAVTSLFEIEVRSCRQLEVTTDNGEAKDAITAMY